jgi:hypothetical protein
MLRKEMQKYNAAGREVDMDKYEAAQPSNDSLVVSESSQVI